MIYSKESFNSISQWVKEVKNNSNPNVKLILVGNKCDLEEERKVKKEEAEQVKNEFDFLFFIETSAKTGFNSKQLFITISKILLNDYNQLKEKGYSFKSNFSTNSILNVIDSNEKADEEKLSHKKNIDDSHSNSKCCN